MLVTLNRLLAATYAALLVAAPALAAAQQAADPAPGDRSWGWLWVIAAALVLVALFRLFFSSPRHEPPARRP